MEKEDSELKNVSICRIKGGRQEVGWEEVHKTNRRREEEGIGGGGGGVKLNMKVPLQSTFDKNSPSL